MAKSQIIGAETAQLRDGKLAVRFGPAQYATPIEVYGLTSVTADARLITAIREGNGKRLALLARTAGGSVTISGAVGQLDVLAAVLGQSYKTSGPSGERVGRMGLYAGQSIPYLGFTAGADDENGLQNAFHFFVPKAKVQSDTIRLWEGSGNEDFNLGNFEITLEAVADDAYNTGAQNEIQNLALGSPTAGNFTLTFGAETTAAIAFDASAANIQSALESLNNIGSGNVTVTGDGSGGFDIEFVGNKAYARLVLLSGTGDGSFDGTLAITSVQRGDEGADLIMDMWEDEDGTTPLLPPALPQL
jgi:hypothetical protein